MKFYKVECLTEDGYIEINGYYIDRKNAEAAKVEMDLWKRNKKYEIKQDIVEIETED